jgi:transposase
MTGGRYARNTADLKSKEALEALREQLPIHDIAKRYQIHPTQVTEWKKGVARQRQ